MEEAYNYLHESILSGRIPLGAPIYEVEVALSLNSSRSPVREALKLLEAEGLVNSFNGRGSFAIRITKQDLEEIFEIRLLFEVSSLSKALKNISHEFWDEIKNEVEALDADSSSEEFYKVDRRLHHTIIGCCGNSRLKLFYQRLETQIDIVLRISAQSPSHFSNSRNYHLQIINSMKKNDLKAAEQYMTEHIDDVRQNTIQVFLYRSTQVESVAI
jgi:DNA-binding GntR family transcriptional regulator